MESWSSDDLIPLPGLPCLLWGVRKNEQRERGSERRMMRGVLYRDKHILKAQQAGKTECVCVCIQSFENHIEENIQRQELYN